MTKLDLQHPDVSYRPCPFWSWNDRLDPEELRRQIREMHRQGIGGFFMHARGGLQTVYLSDEWMACVRACCDEAGRLGISAVCVGMAQDAIDQTVKYTKERVQFGKRISQFQNTQFKLAEYQTKVEAARLMVYNCASLMDNGQRVSHLSSMAKYYASDVLNEVVRGCLQLHGGYGYSKEFVIEKLYRDAKLTEIFEGTSEIQKKIIAKWMGVK